MNRINKLIVAGILVLGMQAAWVRAQDAPKLPDLTAGGEKDKTHDWLLGPTGLRGWMFTKKGIRVSAFKVLAKYHFQEGIRAAPLVAKGKYGCHNAVEIMTALETYGSAAREIVPDLRELIVDYKELLKEWQFPDTTIPAVEHAIKVIEAAKDHPPILSAGSTPAMTEEPKK